MNPIPDDHPTVVEFIKLASALPDILSHDFAESFKIYEARQDDPFARRLFIRAVMTNIEGQMAVIRQQLLVLHDMFSINAQLDEEIPSIARAAQIVNFSFSIKDYFVLLGRSLKEVKRGNPKPREEFICVEESIKFLFRLHGKVYGHSITPLGEGDGWKAFSRLRQKRNALTHPKMAADLDVTATQAHEALAVHVWMQNYLDAIYEVQATKLKASYEAMISEA